MRVGEVAVLALRGLAANKLRSTLTTLGILIGVAAVILLTALGRGASVAVQHSIEGLGTNILTVSPLRQAADGGAVTARALTLGDARALLDAKDAPDITSASPVVSTSATMTYQDRRYGVGQFLGSYPGYFEATNARIAAGTAFTDNDVTRAGKVVVLGATVAGQLFGSSAAAVGRPLLVNDVEFVVVGVLAAKGSSGLADVDDTVVAPLTTVENALTGHRGLSQVLVRAASVDALPAAQAQVIAILDARHRISDPRGSDFRVLRQQPLRAAYAQAVETFTVLLACLAGISLVLAGIGITSIMLGTATERIREIGIRTAVGTPKWAVLGQCLAEAALLSVLGGLLGIAAGVALAQFPIAGIHPVVTRASVLLAFGMSVLVGLFFGSYPAGRAASSRPVEALRTRDNAHLYEA
jgi:putative ABC transport system permease protein